ncbi:MAG: AsmA protein [Rhodobacteraceae bacterium HLUCCA12]|nr:MAG: AsmA protein [Rhodobacteraceae bacterium HLUCCA12]
MKVPTSHDRDGASDRSTPARRTTRRWSVRRWALTLGVIVAIVAGAGALAYRALPDLVPDQRLRAALSDHVATWTGSEARLRHFGDISLDRGLRVALDDVVLAGSAGGVTWRIEVAALRASIRAMPLLRGKIEVGQLVLDRPRIRIHDGEISLPDTPITSDADGDAPDTPMPVGELILTDATIASSGMEALRGIDLRLAAAEETAGVLLSGGLPVGERRIGLEAWLENPLSAFSAEGSQARLALQNLPAQQPATVPSPPPQAATVALDQGRAARALLWVTDMLGLSPAGSLALEGQFALTPRALRIADASMSVKSLLFEGDLDVVLPGTAPPGQQLNRVLDGAGRAWEEVAEAFAAGTWRAAPLTLDWLAPVDITLDAGMREAGIAGPDLEARRLRLETRDANLNLSVRTSGDIGEMAAEAMLTPDTDTGGIRVDSNGRLDRVDLETLGEFIQAQAQAPPPLVSPMELPNGRLDGRYDLAARGETLGALLSSLDGSIEAEARDGSIAGADLILTLEAVAEGRRFMTERDGPLIPAAGRTYFDTVEGRVDFVPGRAELRRASIRGGRYAIELNGEAALPVGEMQVEGQASLHADDPDDEDAASLVDLPFGLGGTLSAPVVAVGVPNRDGDTDIRPASDRTSQ